MDVKETFENYMPDWCATDVGTWKLKLTNVKGEVFQEEGCLFSMSYPKLSKQIRKKLHRKDLLLFDGD